MRRRRPAARCGHRARGGAARCQETDNFTCTPAQSRPAGWTLVNCACPTCLCSRGPAGPRALSLYASGRRRPPPPLPATPTLGNLTPPCRPQPGQPHPSCHPHPGQPHPSLPPPPRATSPLPATPTPGNLTPPCHPHPGQPHPSRTATARLKANAPPGPVHATLTVPLPGGWTRAVKKPLGLPVDTVLSVRYAPPGGSHWSCACSCPPFGASRSIPQTSTVDPEWKTGLGM